MQLNVNGQIHNIDVEPNMPLLWAIRESIGLTGTKYGCGVAQCGACSVYLNGELVRSCSIPVSAVGSAKITTIEALSKDNSHPVQKAWVALDVPQCGYCQSGQVMAAAAIMQGGVPAGYSLAPVAPATVLVSGENTCVVSRTDNAVPAVNAIIVGN